MELWYNEARDIAARMTAKEAEALLEWAAKLEPPRKVSKALEKIEDALEATEHHRKG